MSKADYLERRLRAWGWDAHGEVQEINWGWQRTGSDSEVVIMGLDRFEVRRMTRAGGYSCHADKVHQSATRQVAFRA